MMKVFLFLIFLVCVICLWKFFDATWPALIAFCGLFWVGIWIFAKIFTAIVVVVICAIMAKLIFDKVKKR